jgi:hypothetical protein
LLYTFKPQLLVSTMNFDAQSSTCSSDQLNSNLYGKLSNATNIAKLSMQLNIPTDCLVSSICGNSFPLHSQPEVRFNLKKTIEELKNTLWTTYNNIVISSNDSHLIIQAEDDIREALDMLATSRGTFVMKQMGFSKGLLSIFSTRRPGMHNIIENCFA